MNINLEYKRSEEDQKKTSNAALTADYINFAINQTHKDGIEGQLKRIVGRIQRKIDEAVDSKEKEIVLEEAEIDFLKKCFEKVKVPPQLIKYWLVLEDEIELLGKDNK